MAWKTCSKCRVTYPLTNYYKDTRTSDGRVSQCKHCISKSRKEYYQKNSKERKEYAKRYRAENLEKVSAYNKAYYRAVIKNS